MSDAATDKSGGQPTDSGQDSPPSEDPLTYSFLPGETVLYYLYNNGLSLLSEYGWYVLLTTVVLALAWSRLKPHYYQWKKKREDWIDEQNFDPNKAETYQDAMLKARARMQRDLNEQARVYQEQKEKKEIEERDERIKQWEEFKVVSTKKSKPKDKGRPTPRQDYYPLGGGGAGGGYRPSRRTVGRGGG
ncbi:selenoprotein S B-like [Halichondria panicea]|uniref:selenoprotein S B-like n=1 Tax=Halichondria panicea TaxID=6063 RepID=UPI00312BC0B7